MTVWGPLGQHLDSEMAQYLLCAGSSSGCWWRLTAYEIGDDDTLQHSDMTDGSCGGVVFQSGIQIKP